MSTPWRGLAKPLTDGAYGRAATALGCEGAAVRAIFAVESKAPFRADGTVERRFEPHKMPASKMHWRESLKIPQRQRDDMFDAAYRASPLAALRASSWGGPQIMGDNAQDAGFSGPVEMVEAMADSADAHLDAFVSLVKAWGLDSAVRAHDWYTFARRYNGSGQPEVYAKRIEAEYRRLSGSASPVVLRIGDRGADVKRLQKAIGVEADGAFGPETERAVRTFQAAHDLPVDGIVGRRTWATLEGVRDAVPPIQPTPTDSKLSKAWKGLGGAAGVAAIVGLGEDVKEVVPPFAFDLLGYGAVALILAAGAALTARWLRS